MFGRTKPESDEYCDQALLRKKQGIAIVKLVQREYEEEWRENRGLQPKPIKKAFHIKPIQKPSDQWFVDQADYQSGFSLGEAAEESKGLPDCLSSEEDLAAARPARQG